MDQPGRWVRVPDVEADNLQRRTAVRAGGSLNLCATGQEGSISADLHVAAVTLQRGVGESVPVGVVVHVRAQLYNNAVGSEVQVARGVGA